MEAASIAGRDPHAAIVVLSSFASTVSTRRALGTSPVLEFLFEPPSERAGRIAPPAARQVFVATTARVASAVEASVGVRPAVLGHKPVPRVGNGAGSEVMADDLAAVLDAMQSAPSLLALGVLHGKKDLDLIARLPTLVPEGWAVVVAGDPQVDGISVHTRLRADPDTALVHGVARRLSRRELEQLVTSSTVVLIPQRAGEASMSGVLLDAAAARRPAVARLDSSAGDVIEACRGGATFAADIPASVRAAIERASGMRWDGSAARQSEHGLFPPGEWGARVIDALDPARSAAR
jgi:hypothetical protein